MISTACQLLNNDVINGARFVSLVSKTPRLQGTGRRADSVALICLRSSIYRAVSTLANSSE